MTKMTKRGFEARADALRKMGCSIQRGMGVYIIKAPDGTKYNMGLVRGRWIARGPSGFLAESTKSDAANAIIREIHRAAAVS